MGGVAAAAVAAGERGRQPLQPPQLLLAVRLGGAGGAGGPPPPVHRRHEPDAGCGTLNFASFAPVAAVFCQMQLLACCHGGGAALVERHLAQLYADGIPCLPRRATAVYAAWCGASLARHLLTHHDVAPAPLALHVCGAAYLTGVSCSVPAGCWLAVGMKRSPSCCSGRAQGEHAGVRRGGNAQRLQPGAALPRPRPLSAPHCCRQVLACAPCSWLPHYVEPCTQHSTGSHQQMPAPELTVGMCTCVQEQEMGCRRRRAAASAAPAGRAGSSSRTPGAASSTSRWSCAPRPVGSKALLARFHVFVCREQ